MKSIKKLGIALALAVSCLVAAPVTPLEGPAETKLEATADLRRGYEVEGGVLCTPRRCDPRPFEPTICCCYGQGAQGKNPLDGRPLCVMA